MTSVCQASDAEAPPSAFRLDRSYLNRLLEGPSRHRLKLPPALEADYQEYHYSDAAAHLRAYWPSVIVAISVLGGAMFAFDMISPDRRSLVVAGLIAFYVLAGVVAVSAYLPALRSRLKLMVGLAATVALFAIQIDTVLTPVHNYAMYSIPQLGVVLVTIATFTISNLLLRPALVCVLLAKTLFLSVVLLGGVHVEWHAFWIYSIGSISLGVIISFSQEIRERTLFLQSRLLLIEKRATDEMAAQLEQLSRTDGLTGLVNRRHFEEALSREWAACLRDRAPIGLLFVDVDHFKTYNDRYGHPAGDSCLQAVAGALQSQATRPSDVMARFGGEEFVGIFPRTTPEGVLMIAERLIAAVDALAIPHEASLTGSHVTVSVGAAARVPRPGDSSAMFLQEADNALYRAKAAGRHRCMTSWQKVESTDPYS